MPRPYAVEETTKAPDWHALVAWDVLLNNMATGLFLVAAAFELASPRAFGAVARAAYPLALGLLTADLVCLVLDLGHPLRFHHMLRVWKPTSPMSLGTWCLTAFAFVLSAIIGLDLFAAGGVARVRPLLLIVGLPFALGSAAYKGVLFSTSSQPGWKDARWFGAYLLNSALLLGGVELLVLAEFTTENEPRALASAFGVACVFNLVVQVLLIRELAPAFQRAYSRARAIGFAAASLGLGAALPLGLSMLGGGPGLTALIAISTIGGCLIARFAIVGVPHHARTILHHDAST